MLVDEKFKDLERKEMRGCLLIIGFIFLLIIILLVYTSDSYQKKHYPEKYWSRIKHELEEKISNLEIIIENDQYTITDWAKGNRNPKREYYDEIYNIYRKKGFGIGEARRLAKEDTKMMLQAGRYLIEVYKESKSDAQKDLIKTKRELEWVNNTLKKLQSSK